MEEVKKGHIFNYFQKLYYHPYGNNRCSEVNLDFIYWRVNNTTEGIISNVIWQPRYFEKQKS